MAERTAITEEDGVHKDWYERCKEMTLAELPAFLKELSEDYEHDYGTICHACAASAVAACWAMQNTPQGGITGFQAGAIGWEFLRHWGAPDIGKSGARLLSYDDLLFPQYKHKFTSISPQTLEAIKNKAEKNLEEQHEQAHPNVLSHWRFVAEGGVPFGLQVEAD